MNVEFFTDTTIMEKGIEALVQTGDYKNREAVLQEAFMLFLRTYPEHRLMIAVRLYHDGHVALPQAVTVSGLSQGDFEAVLLARGIEIFESAEATLQQGWQETMVGDTRPISELWDGIDCE